MFKIYYRSYATHEDLQIAKRLGMDTVELIWVDAPYSMGRQDEMVIKWGTVIALLYEEGYTGDLAIETHSEYWGNNLERDLILSKRHLEQFIVY